MELVFIGPVLLPITPESIETSKPGANSTTRLIDDGEINIRHSVGLREYAFDVILPCGQSYPFQIYQLAGMEATAFTTYFDLLQRRKIPFPFIQVTWSNNIAATVTSLATGILNIMFSNVMCTIEEQTVSRDSSNGLDYIVSLKLKEYKDYGTKYVSTGTQDAEGNITYKVESKTSSYSYTAELNKLASEITAKLGAIGATAASAFKLGSGGSGEDVSTNNQDNKYVGW